MYLYALRFLCFSGRLCVAATIGGVHNPAQESAVLLTKPFPQHRTENHDNDKLQVLATDDDQSTATGANSISAGAASDGDTSALLPALVCDACAARIFPESSVRPAGEVRYRYGDDGPVTAVDVVLEIPGIQVGTLEAASPVVCKNAEVCNKIEADRSLHRRSGGKGLMENGSLPWKTPVSYQALHEVVIHFQRQRETFPELAPLEKWLVIKT